jgi:Na+/melibiose symporter-like transporter
MEKTKRTVKLGDVIGFGTGGMFTYGFQLMITGYYLMYFMTDVAGFDTTLAASLYSAIQVIKLVTMMFSGVIVDSVSFKTGKYRTWYLIASIILGVFLPLSFAYWNISTSTYVVLFMICYTVQTIGYNVGWTAMRSIIGKMSQNNADVVSLNTAAQVGGTFAATVYGFIGTPILTISLWAGTKQAYCGASCIYGALIIIGAIYLYNLCGKYEKAHTGAAEVAAPKKERVPFVKMLSALKGPMIPFFVSYSFNAAQSGFFNTLLVYYSTYVLMNPSAAALSVSCNSICGVVGQLCTPFLSKYVSKKNQHLWGMVLCAIGYVCLAMFGSTAASFIIIRALITLASAPSGVVQSAICNDIGDNFEMKGEEAPRAFLQGLTGSTTRLGYTLSSFIASFSLAAIGYVAGMTFTDAMITKMVILIAVGPAIVCAIAAVSMIFYHVDEKVIAEYNAKKFATK